jgi:hypothetical protein
MWSGSYFLSLPDKDSFDLDSMGRVHYLWANLAEKTYKSCQKHKSVSVPITLDRLPFFWRHSVYDNNKKKYGTQQKIGVFTLMHKTQLHFTPIYSICKLSAAGHKHLTV